MRKTCVKPAQLVLLPGSVSVELICAAAGIEITCPCVYVCVFVFVCEEEKERDFPETTVDQSRAATRSSSVRHSDSADPPVFTESTD